MRLWPESAIEICPCGSDATAAGEVKPFSFRHTYRSRLDETGAPMTVQQELMRHASIQTTMNVYRR
jgi:integrase